MKKILSLLIGITISAFTYGQGNIILKNASFEDNPRAGGEGGFNISIKSWFDCGEISFKGESPPDIHPMDFWQVTSAPAEGNTYLGMVVRDNESWESVSQRLSDPLEGGLCYSFSIKLARSDKYISGSRATGARAVNYTKPAKLRIWGGDGFCGRKELLAESSPVSNSEWQTYGFEIKPKRSHRYIVLEAFYETMLFIYNGHILVDGASDIVRVACPGEDYVMVPPPKKEKTKIVERPKKKKPKKEKPAKPVDVIVDSSPPPVTTHTHAHNTNEHSHKPKLLTELDRKTITKGQTINIKDLYFDADTSSIHQSSYPVLEEVFDFLEHHEDIEVEIRGHTNGVSGISHKYCDKLSSERAKAIAAYLISKGIDPNRVKYKGYGKRKPIATNRTKEGRIKNQRVEIKILNFNAN